MIMSNEALDSVIPVLPSVVAEIISIVTFVNDLLLELI